MGRPFLELRAARRHDIPRGIRGGQHLRLAGQGGTGFGNGPAGDLYLEIEFAPSPHFRVDGRDVYLDLPVAPWEAALGAEIAVPTPDGNLQMTVPSGSAPGLSCGSEAREFRAFRRAICTRCCRSHCPRQTRPPGKWPIARWPRASTTSSRADHSKDDIHAGRQPSQPTASSWRARSAVRLSRDLELNAADTAFVIDLLDKIEALKARLRRLGSG